MWILRSRGRLSLRYLASKSAASVTGKRFLYAENHAGSSKDITPTCEVCRKLQKLFQGLLGPSWRSSSWEVIALGSSEKVLLSTDCPIHPRLIYGCFGDALYAHPKLCLEAYNFSRCAVIISFHGVASGLLPLESTRTLKAANDSLCYGKILDGQWIEDALLNQWKRSCENHHRQECQIPPWPDGLEVIHPTWLVDAHNSCLVAGAPGVPYVALSYMWGTKPFFQTRKSNIEQLQKQDAFLSTGMRLDIPNTIIHAMAIVKVLQERYLWVDSLCIVQDDAHARHRQIANMASIYAHAAVTIIAEDGEDANFGLRGIRGISEPRSCQTQQIIALGQHLDILCPISSKDMPSAWSSRGWTFQEEAFSKRKIIFGRGGVRWECNSSSYVEGIVRCNVHDRGMLKVEEHARQGARKLPTSSMFPDFDIYKASVLHYNHRSFTYPEDAPAAFAGIITFLRSLFPGGFIGCIPRLFLDMALCWQPRSTCGRRNVSKGATLPSWSWVGWQGKLDLEAWESCSEPEYVKLLFPRRITRVLPLVNWSSRKDGTTAQQVDLQDGFQKYKQDFFYGSAELPSGWKRSTFDRSVAYSIKFGYVAWPDNTKPSYLYTHDSTPGKEYWYPIPLSNGLQIESTRDSDNILCCRTNRAWFKFAENLGNKRQIVVSLRDANGNWAGVMHLHEEPTPTDGTMQTPLQDQPTHLHELVAISKGYAAVLSTKYRSHWIDEWSHPERPQLPSKRRYEYYNVLWVEREKGRAYRKGLGRVAKAAWEAQDLEAIDLELG